MTNAGVIAGVLSSITKIVSASTTVQEDDMAEDKVYLLTQETR